MFFDKIIADIFTARDTKIIQTHTHTHRYTYIYVSVCVYVFMCCVGVNIGFVSVLVKMSKIYTYCDIAKKMAFFRCVMKIMQIGLRSCFDGNYAI